MNKGLIKDNKYIKKVSFSRAVLWMKKSLSVPPEVINYIRDNNIETMEFYDDKKKEVWKFRSSDVLEKGSLQRYGQEEQFYFPINLAIVNEYKS